LHAQLLRRALVEQTAHPFVQFLTRDNLVAAGHFDQLQPPGAFVIPFQLGERRVHVFFRFRHKELVDGLAGERLGGRKYQSL
jgi:hypothetical protein